MPNQQRKTICPVNGCRASREPNHVMCKSHWHKVPKELRDRIWKEYKEARGSESHLMAIRAAIDEVEQQETTNQD